MAWDHEASHCPLDAVDRRLDDVHRFWHKAERAYFDPDEFRISIQAAIQTSRQVSFVLQKHKAGIPNFDTWYQSWQAKLADIPLMKWMVDARNRIEKQGDLEAHSFVSAEIVASHLDNGPKIQVPANLTDAPLKLVKSIPDSMVGDHVKKHGILRIRRRWIENTLPDFELLEAVAIAYGQLSHLVYSAHVQMGLSGPTTTKAGTGEQYPDGDRDGRLPCMIGHEDSRTLDVWLANGQPLEFEEVRQKIDFAKLPDTKERYGIDPAKMFSKSDKVRDQARSLFETARKMFEKDGYHIMIAFLMRNGRLVDMRELRPMEHGHKFMMMRTLAHLAQRLAADAVILTSETWRAPRNPENPYMRAIDSPERREYLTTAAASKNGEPVMLFAEIMRDGETVKLGETLEGSGGAHFNFAPFYQIWKKPIPTHWGVMSAHADGSE
jgi:hypothetical protein